MLHYLIIYLRVVVYACSFVHTNWKTFFRAGIHISREELWGNTHLIRHKKRIFAWWSNKKMIGARISSKLGKAMSYDFRNFRHYNLQRISHRERCYAKTAHRRTNIFEKGIAYPSVAMTNVFSVPRWCFSSHSLNSVKTSEKGFASFTVSWIKEETQIWYESLYSLIDQIIERRTSRMTS